MGEDRLSLMAALKSPGARSQQRAFTLNELLLVIAVIAMLAAVGFTVYRRSVEKGKQMVCAGNLRQLAVAIRMYAEDHDGKPPPKETSSFVGTYMEGMVILALDRYVRERSLWLCPSDPWAGQWVRDVVPHRLTSYESHMLMLIMPPYPDGYLLWDARCCGPGPLWHLGGFNAAFPDGHVKWQRNQDPGRHYPDPVWEDPD